MTTINDALKEDIALVGDLVCGSNGDIGTIAGLNNLKIALFHRLITIPGTLVHRPSYGVGISLFQNAINSFWVQQKIADLIAEQFAQDVRVQSVSSVSIIVDDNNPELVKITVSIIPVGYTEIPMTFTPFNGGAAA